MNQKRICYCDPDNPNGIKDCTFGMDDCCGPVRDDGTKGEKKISEYFAKQGKAKACLI